MREEQTPIRILECEGCGVFFSCKLTRNGVCKGIKLFEIDDRGGRTGKEVDLSIFTPKWIGDVGLNVASYDKSHIYDRVVEGKCLCNKCSDSTNQCMCGKVETINWEHRPVKKFTLSKFWAEMYSLLEKYERRFSIIMEMRGLNEAIATGKERLVDLKKETTKNGS